MKHKIKRALSWYVLSCMFVMHLSTVNAQNGSVNVLPIKNITLPEAIQMSLENSNQLKAGKAKADQADAQYKQATNNYLPDLKASGSYLRINNPDVKLELKTGGSSSGSSTVQATGIPKISELSYGMATASIPLFSGLKIRNNTNAARFQKMAANSDLENDREEVIENTILAYNNLYKAAKSVDLVKENLKEQDRRVIDFNNLEQNGLLPRNDLLKAQLQQSSVELALLDAQNNLHVATANLNLMLGLPENTILNPDSIAFDLTNEAGSIANWEQTAMQNRKDMQSLQFHEKAANEFIKVAKGDYYPGLALTGGYVAANIPGLMTVTNALNIGIGLQYNVGSLWKTHAKVDEAKAKVRELQANENMLVDRVRIQVNEAFEAYLLSRKKIAVYELAIAQAEENYRIVKDKYNNTLATTTELLEADVAQLQAQLNYTFAKADAVVAYKQLQQVCGTLSSAYQNIK